MREASRNADGSGFQGEALSERAPVASCQCIFLHHKHIECSVFARGTKPNRQGNLKRASKPLLLLCTLMFSSRDQCKKRVHCGSPNLQYAGFSTEVGAWFANTVGTKTQTKQPCLLLWFRRATTLHIKKPIDFKEAPIRPRKKDAKHMLHKRPITQTSLHEIAPRKRLFA